MNYILGHSDDDDRGPRVGAVREDTSSYSHSRNCEQALHPAGGGKNDGMPSKLLRRSPWTGGAAGNNGFMLRSYMAAALTLSALVFLTLRVGAECSDRALTQLGSMPSADDQRFCAP